MQREFDMHQLRIEQALQGFVGVMQFGVCEVFGVARNIGAEAGAWQPFEEAGSA